MSKVKNKTPRKNTQAFEDHFIKINERPVDDISLQFFYSPHTLTLLIALIAYNIFSAFRRDDSVLENNIESGILAVCITFLIIGVLTFPNGPFTRPHPVVWKIVFGFSGLYLFLLTMALFQDLDTINKVKLWYFPELANFTIDSEKEYGVNCEISFEQIWHYMDVFVVGHFLGWTMKAMLIRHYGICWTISVTWEITEVFFAHLLPNFKECWWDAMILDVLICNGLGIWFGMKICEVLEIRTYNWESIKDIQSTSGKLRRAVLQFTPASWTHVRWLDPNSSYMRFFAVYELVFFWQVTELNTFFLKHIFEIPPAHVLIIGRLLIIGAIVAPSLRQYYVYVTDTRCQRVGTQCWVFGAITITEASICIKFGLKLFAQTQILNIIGWLLVQSLMSLLCVYLCCLNAKYKKQDKESSFDEEIEPEDLTNENNTHPAPPTRSIKKRHTNSKESTTTSTNS